MDREGKEIEIERGMMNIQSIEDRGRINYFGWKRMEYWIDYVHVLTIWYCSLAPGHRKRYREGI